MTKETQILPEYDYELRFDAEEVGAAACTYFGLVTDYGSPADILVRFPAVGFGRHEENAREKAEALAKEIVRRWNTEAAIKYKAAFHKDDRYLTTDDGQVFDRNNNRFVPDDELEAINTYEKVSTPAIADGVGVEWCEAYKRIFERIENRDEEMLMDLQTLRICLTEIMGALNQADMDLSVIKDCIPSKADRETFLAPVHDRIKNAISKWGT